MATYDFTPYWRCNAWMLEERARAAAAALEAFLADKTPADREHQLTPECPDCHRCGPGHGVHFIQARYVGRRPEGWRDVVVQRVEGRSASGVDMEGNPVELWFHAPWEEELPVGIPLLLHELHVLRLPDGELLPVTIPPELPALQNPPDFSHLRTDLVFVNLATGRGKIVFDHERPF